MSKKSEVKTSSKGSLNEDENIAAAGAAENDKQSSGKKKTGLVASLYNYSKSSGSGSNSSLNKEDSGDKAAAKQQSAALTEAELVEKSCRRKPIRMADVLGLTQPTESNRVS